MEEGDEMKNRNILRDESGVSLLEVLLSMTILGIIFISVMNLFSQSYTYTKANEDKTVGINVARNVLYYMEQVPFKNMQDELANDPNKPQDLKDQKLIFTNDSCSKSNLFNEDVCKGIFETKLNNMKFSTTVTVQNHQEAESRDYLIPVEVTVKWSDKSATVRGYIKNE